MRHRSYLDSLAPAAGLAPRREAASLGPPDEAETKEGLIDLLTIFSRFGPEHEAEGLRKVLADWGTFWAGFLSRWADQSDCHA